MELKAWMDTEWPECPRALRNALLPLSAIHQLKLSPALPKDERMRRWHSPDGQELLFTAEQAVVSAQSLTGKNGASAHAVQQPSALCALCCSCYCAARGAQFCLVPPVLQGTLCCQSMLLNCLDKLPHACLSLPEMPCSCGRTGELS